MDTPIPEFLAEAANRRVSDIFIIAGRPLAEKIDGHLLDRGDRLMPDQTENLLRTIYGLAENRDISRLMETGDDDFSFSIPGVSRFRVNVSGCSTCTFVSSVKVFLTVPFTSCFTV